MDREKSLLPPLVLSTPGEETLDEMKKIILELPSRAQHDREREELMSLIREAVAQKTAQDGRDVGTRSGSWAHFKALEDQRALIIDLLGALKGKGLMEALRGLDSNDKVRSHTATTKMGKSQLSYLCPLYLNLQHYFFLLIISDNCLVSNHRHILQKMGPRFSSVVQHCIIRPQKQTPFTRKRMVVAGQDPQRIQLHDVDSSTDDGVSVLLASEPSE